MSKTVIGEDDEPTERPAARPRPIVAPANEPEAKEKLVTEMLDLGDSSGSKIGAATVIEPSDDQAVAGGEADGLPDVPARAPEAPVAAPPPWRGLTIAIIDDAMHLPSLNRLTKEESVAVTALLMANSEAVADLQGLGCGDGATVDERLQALAESTGPLATLALLDAASPDALRMTQEHRVFRRLRAILEEEVQQVTVCDPFVALPDLTAHNLILLDYFLQGPPGGRSLSVAVATAIRNQQGRAADQQIVLMSSLETVRDARGEFRSDTDLAGSAFAFVGKADLNEPWKVKAHLGMLERARPYSPALISYRTGLDEALVSARDDLLKLVDDLDIGDYAFLQSRALMKDGHPLGNYVFWLLSSQLMALAFERDEMRERQRALDTLEFVGAPFAATEPSTVVANLLHSALVSRNMGPLGPHPRAKAGSAYAAYPRVQLGDVFLDANRTKAVVVMSADCDLAFSPIADREPEEDTPVMLVPGRTVRLRDAKEDTDPNTEGLVHREEVYRIVWDFAKYRSVQLGGLEGWLRGKGYDVANRDRLRPLFALKLQQEFGAHLMRVGPPIMPPMTSGATGRMLVSFPEREEVGGFTAAELMLTRFKGVAWLRVTPRIAGGLREQCDALRSRMEEHRNGSDTPKKKSDWQKKIDALAKDLNDDDFWISLLEGIELNAAGSIKAVGPLGFVIGGEWTDNKMRIVLEITEGAFRKRKAEAASHDELTETGVVEAGAVSAAA